MVTTFQTGDWVVYWAQKHSDHPSPAAEKVEPETNGEGYRYLVKKYWVVTAVLPDRVEVATRRGKTRILSLADPHLRHARWWERFFFANRFPRLNAQPEEAATARAG